MRRRVLSNNIFYHKLMISVKIKKRWLRRMKQRNRDKKISRIKIANKTENLKMKRKMRTLNLRTKTTSRLLQTKNY